MGMFQFILESTLYTLRLLRGNRRWCQPCENCHPSGPFSQNDSVHSISLCLASSTCFSHSLSPFLHLVDRGRVQFKEKLWMWPLKTLRSHRHDGYVLRRLYAPIPHSTGRGSFRWAIILECHLVNNKRGTCHQLGEEGKKKIECKRDFVLIPKNSWK